MSFTMGRKGTHLFYHPLSLEHHTGSGHPERVARVQSILNYFEETDLNDLCQWVTPEPASFESIRARSTWSSIRPAVWSRSL